MAMLMLDGFEGYAQNITSGSGSFQNGQWGMTNATSETPRFVDHDSRGVAIALHATTSAEKLWTNQNLSLTTMTVGASMYFTTLSQDLRFMSIGDNDSGGGANYEVSMVELVRTSLTGVINVKTSRGNNVYPTTGIMSAGSYQYYELQCVITGPTTAWVRARQNGVYIFDQEVAITRTSMTNVGFQLITGGGATLGGYIDDFYQATDANFYGPLAIKRVALTQATHQDLSPVGAGTAQGCIDEELCDLDATYVVSSIPGAKQTFTAQFDEPPMFVLLSSETRSEALSSTGQRFIDGPNGSYRNHATEHYPEEYANKPVILSTLYDGSALTQSGANSQEFGFEIVNG